MIDGSDMFFHFSALMLCEIVEFVKSSLNSSSILDVVLISVAILEELRSS